jgi:thiol-disulfide isomerase/thioredoxin
MSPTFFSGPSPPLHFPQIHAPKPVIVDFSAEWCGPCKMIAPRFEQLAQLNPEIAFYKVDVDELYEVALQENIQAVSILSVLTFPVSRLYRCPRSFSIGMATG